LIFKKLNIKLYLWGISFLNW